MTDALGALGRAILSAFHPRMLLLTLLPLVGAIAIWTALTWFAVDPLLHWAHQWIMADGQVPEVVNSASDILGTWVKPLIVPFVVFVILWPLVASTAVALASIVVMPFVVAHVQSRGFEGLERRGNASMLHTVWIALKATVVFVIGWVITLPLWLIPGVGFFLPFVWTAYLLVAVMSFDSLAAHASREEFKRLYRENSRGAWLIGLACAILSVIPPFFLVVPVFSALAFTYFYFAKLREIRA